MRSSILLCALAGGVAVQCASGGGGGAGGSGSARGSAKDEPSRDRRGLEDYLRPSDISDVRLSPDGETVAVMSNATGETRLAFLRTSDLSTAGGFRLTGIETFHRVDWANNSRIVAELARSDGPLSIPARYGELYAINSDGTNKQLIFGYRRTEMQTGSSIIKRDKIDAWGSVIDDLPADDERVLVMARHFPNGVEPGPVEVYYVNVLNGLRNRILGGPGYVQQYFVDETRNVRLAISLNREALYEGFWLDDKGEWIKLDGFGKISHEAFPISFSASKRLIYLIDDDEQGPALFAASIDDGKRTVVVREHGVEPSSVWFDHKSGVPVVVLFEPDFPKWKILDSKHPLTTMLKLAFQAADGRQVRIVSTTPDQTQAVMLAYSDREPGTYLLVRAKDQTVKVLFQERQTKGTGAEVKPISFKASDGLQIHGYLTVPANAGPHPMIVMPHGGPHGVRDRWDYDPEVQLFASKGYAVLQVNFRGSGGYGQKFGNSGYQKWGSRVQDDIIEATRWAIDNKHADPKKICTFGASFGGYSAVQSTIRAPEMFQCAVGYAGVYDLSLFYDQGDIQQTERGRAYLLRAVGDDEASLAAASPAKNAGKIPVPVLLIHGEKDERAPIAHAKALCEAMHAEKKRCEEHYVADEYHGFFDVQNRVEAYERVFAFLDEQMR